MILRKVTENLLYAPNTSRNNEEVVLPIIELSYDIDKVVLYILCFL